VVNRTEGIGVLGGAYLTGEECYLLAKFARALGIVYIDHQTRSSHMPSVEALRDSLGFGAMSNHIVDLKNSDVVLIIGANPADNHPVLMRWIKEAREERQAKVITVDPRFTRTSSQADIHVGIRPGTDIAFLGGLINYALEKERINTEYIKHYTNASFIIDEGYDFSEGIFSGFNESEGRYSRDSWQYKRDEQGNIEKDMSLSNERCVYQLLRRHFSVYTSGRVAEVTGCSEEVFKKVADEFTASFSSAKAGAIVYGSGLTGHTTGTQAVRACIILSLLLGNIGVSGGGVNPLREASNEQGASDHGLLWEYLSGYLPCPRASEQELGVNLESEDGLYEGDTKSYIGRNVERVKDPLSVNLMSRLPSRIVSLLKAYYGVAAKGENEFCYHYLPKVDEGRDYSSLSLFRAIDEGKVKGLLVFGQNPCVSFARAGYIRKVLEKLDWLVVVDLWETETASFWKRPGLEEEEIRKINTEVWLLPAASFAEKQGSITNAGRWVQWKESNLYPISQTKPDLWILDRLQKKLKEKYENDPEAPFPEPIINLSWDYGSGPEADLVAKEINGYAEDTLQCEGKELSESQLLLNETCLTHTGESVCGNWLYIGSYTHEGNMMARRDLSDRGDPNHLGLYINWAWSWPGNQRILHNRASLNPLTKAPWDSRRAVLTWDPIFTKWEGDSPYIHLAPEQAYPFIMKSEGLARIFSPELSDGPLPVHYEPMESPLEGNPLYPKTKNSPTLYIYPGKLGKFGVQETYPYICVLFKLGEHWQSGAMTRNIPWLVELIPNVFVEVPEELIKKLGFKDGDEVSIESERARLSAYIKSTNRLAPLIINGKKIYQIGLPIHWGYKGLARGGAAAGLAPYIGDTNTRTPETKAFLCFIRKKR
jgi:formate dehydrogenase major subunit